MAEHHAFINCLQQVCAGVNGLHPVETAGHLESGVAAVQERQEKEIVTDLRQAGNGLIDLIKRDFSPLRGKPFEVAGRGRAGFVNDKLTIVNVATIDIRMRFTVT